MKVNTDGLVVGNHAILGLDTVFSSEIQGFIFALEFAAQNGWNNIGLESDSSSALAVFKTPSLVLIRNRWHNACRLGVQVISSHI